MDKRVIKAKIKLIIDTPFWGSLATRLELKDWDGDTFATEGKHIFVPAEKYYKDWTFEQLVGVIAHETCHCAFLHPFRLAKRNHFKWNIAGDYAINNCITKNGFQLPKGCLIDSQYDGMTAEKIYNLLPEMQTMSFSMDLIDPKTGETVPGGAKVEVSGYGLDGIDPKKLEQEWKEAVANAAQVAKGQGTLPSGLEEYIDEILFPKVPWQQILYRFLQTAKGNTDFTAYPFNRRHIWREIYLPSMQGESIELCCGIDTSGSISKDDIIRYFSELRGICSIFGNYAIHLFMCDADVHGDEIIITEDSDIPNIAIGRGGTDFRPVFKKIEELELGELPVVYFTDLDGSFPDINKEDVFWLARKSQVSSNETVPFGQLIIIDD